jgi:hypothetical protein
VRVGGWVRQDVTPTESTAGASRRGFSGRSVIDFAREEKGQVGKRNQERRRAKKRQRDARQRPEAGSRPGHGDGTSRDDVFGGPFGAGPFTDRPGQPPRPHRPSLAHIVETIVVDAVEAPDEAADAVLRSSAAELTGPAFREPDDWVAVGLALLGLGERIVHSCWQGGWQPADLVRVVARALSAGHVRLAVDLVAAEGRRHAAATLDQRWSVQLQELGAAVWWDDAKPYLDAVGEREGLDRAGVARCVLDLFRLIGGLPQIPPVGPPPGSGAQRARRQPNPAAAPEPRMLVRIRALLAQAESTNYAEEADAFTAKAQQLMARHSISAALLDADTPGTDEPAARRIGIDNPYEAPKALLLDAVTQANRCRSVWSRHFGFSTVVGYEPDLDLVELLYTSLLVQATTAMNRAGSRRDSHGRSRTRTFRQSFLVAYANRIRQRLTEATESAVKDAAADSTDARTDPRLLPVLAARGDAVRDATKRLFPELVSHALSGSDREGWAHGTAAADRAVLHRHTDAIASD